MVALDFMTTIEWVAGIGSVFLICLGAAGVAATRNKIYYTLMCLAGVGGAFLMFSAALGY